METKHTPGPWTVTRYSTSAGQVRIVTNDSNALPVATANHGDGIGMKTTAANARLIAAAPDHALVARAMSAGVARWERFSDAESGELCFGGLRYWTKLDEFGVPTLSASTREALAKATGKTL